MIIYKTTNNITGHFYIGAHTCGATCNSPCDYLGSGTVLLSQIATYGRENFTRTTLETTTDRSELPELERNHVDNNNPLCLNKNKGGAYNLSGNAIKTTIQGITYNSRAEAAKALGLSSRILTKRLHSSKWPDYTHPAMEK